MAGLFKQKYQDRNGKLRKSAKWYGQYLDADGIRRRVPLCRDKAASQAMLNDLVRQAEQRRSGLIDKFAEHRKQPLREHMADFRIYMSAKGNTGKYIKLICGRVNDLLAGIRAIYIADIQPSKVQAYLVDRREVGLSIRSSNHYLRAIKGFCNWMVKDGRLAENPLQSLSGMNVAVDLRHERRHLTEDELLRLMESTRTGPAFYGLTGSERALLYMVAVYTDLRANEIRSLQWRDLNLEKAPPTITVRAAYSKHRREDVIPLPKCLTNELLEWQQAHENDPESHVFPKLTTHTARILRRDLKAASIPYRDASGRVVDFHALRHTFISRLAKAGVHPKVAQDLARHSDIKLTMNLYTHTVLEDQVLALDKLPDLSGPDIKAADNSLAKTGTDGEKCLTHQLTQTSDFSGQDMSPTGRYESEVGESRIAGEIPDSSQNTSVLHHKSPTDHNAPGRT